MKSLTKTASIFLAIILCALFTARATARAGAATSGCCEQ